MNKEEITIGQAMEVLVKTLEKDKSYNKAWKDSISMSVQDSGGYKELGDKTADLFISWLIR